MSDCLDFARREARKMLVVAGYNIADLHMVDMFPQTFHLETVVILRK